MRGANTPNKKGAKKRLGNNLHTLQWSKIVQEPFWIALWYF